MCLAAGLQLLIIFIIDSKIGSHIFSLSKCNSLRTICAFKTKEIFLYILAADFFLLVPLQ